MPQPLSMPPGASLDLDLVIAVATRTNRVHQALGTELLHIGPGSATIGLDWPAVLADGSGHTHGVLTAMLDHVCSLAALVALDDPARFGGTVGLRVEYRAPLRPGERLYARAESQSETAHLASVAGVVFQSHDPLDPTATITPCATAACTVAIAGLRP